MMTDREVLELTAELCGLKMEHAVNEKYWQWHGGWGCLESVIDDGVKQRWGGDRWNPLTDANQAWQVIQRAMKWGEVESILFERFKNLIEGYQKQYGCSSSQYYRTINWLKQPDAIFQAVRATAQVMKEFKNDQMDAEWERTGNASS